MKMNYPCIGLVLATGLLFAQLGMAAGPMPVDLGAAGHFTVLAGATITTTGGGTINGDVGASPIAGSAVLLTAAQVNGIIYVVDASGPAGSVIDPVMLTAAKGALTAAYNDVAGRTPVPTGPFLNPGSGNIGGLNLVPGLYKFTGTALITGSDVTLTGGPDDVWIFQIAADLQVGSGIKVILAGGAKARNIFWQVGTSAVLDTFSEFKGTILADQAVTLKTSSTMEGRALAFSAGVTYNGTSGDIPRNSQVITNFIPTNGATFAGTNTAGLSAQASSLLPVSFTVGSGPGVITGGTNLAFSATGLVNIVARQSGNTFFEAAPDVTNTVVVLPAALLAQTITNFIPTNGAAFEGTNLVGLSAQATSFLPVSFRVASGPGLITDGTNLIFSDTGLVSIVASQPGSTFYDAAPSLTNMYTVLPATMQGQAITNFTPTNGASFVGTNKVSLRAQATSLLPVSFAVVNGPGLITGGTNLVFSGTGWVSIVASQSGNLFFNPATSVTNMYTVLPIAMVNQTIANFIPTNGSVFEGTNAVGLSAQASSLLPVSFRVRSGPGVITGGTSLVFAATGVVRVVASQVGNLFYSAAPSVTNTYTVIPPLPAELGWLAISVSPVSGTWQLTAPVGYAGPTTGTGNLAPVSAVVGEYTLVYGALAGYVPPIPEGQFVVVGVTSLFVGTYLQMSPSLTPPAVTATDGTYSNKVQITWPAVAGVLGYEIWKSQTNDTNTALRMASIPDDGSASFLYDDDDVVPIRAYYYWGLSKTATLTSPKGYVDMGYAAINTNVAEGVVDITVNDHVFLPVNATNRSTAGTVSCWLMNNGPIAMNNSLVEFDFHMVASNGRSAFIGACQRAFTLAVGEETLVILPAEARQGLVVREDLTGLHDVRLDVRHLSALYDPNMENNNTLSAGTVGIKTGGVNSPGRSVTDYDGDGKSDLGLLRDNRSRFVFLLSGNHYNGMTWIETALGVGLYHPAMGDYDGDGVLDLGLYDETNGILYVRYSSTGAIMMDQIGGPGYRPAIADYDADGKSDPALYSEISGFWVVWASASGYTESFTWVGGPGYVPVPGDYDGDNRADPVAYSAAEGRWLGQLSAQGYAAASLQFGGAAYLGLTGDYDGDGRADPVLYNTTSGLWIALMSGAGYAPTYYGQGGPGWYPAPGDYDGDGITDPMVYSPLASDNGIWLVLLSMQNHAQAAGRFGGPGYEAVGEWTPGDPSF